MSVRNRTRTLSAFAALAIAAVLAASPSYAGPGHDHGPSETVTAGPVSPRLISMSENYELVGILSGEKLTIYLDRLADTSPVTDATIEVIIEGETIAALAKTDGTYEVASPALARTGSHDVVVTITQGAQADLLIGAITVSDPTHQHADHDHADHHKDEPTTSKTSLPKTVEKGLEAINVSPEAVDRKLSNTPLLAGLTLAFGIIVGAVIQGRAAIMAGIIGLVAIFTAGVAWAGPGHDHGSAPAATQGDAPRRLPDGELFLPKPTQRLLDIRTRVLTSQTARDTDQLIGRVIPDPNRSGLVQSTIGGRLKPAKGKLPILGERVKAGDLLALVEPAFAPIDASDVRQTAGDLEQRIAVLNAQIARQKRLVKKQIASRANLEDLEIERTGLVARRDQLLKSRSQPEQLKAPVDGIIAEVSVVAGQVVTPGQTLINIVDPSTLWVEAISFDPSIDPTDTIARARTTDGRLLKLSFIGRSRALQQQATRHQFRINAPSEDLNIGSPVKVLIEKGNPVTGLVVPKSAIAKSPNGQIVAYKRLEPERYLPTAVRVHDLDGQRVHITSGLKPGDQIIIKGAPLVSQIR